MSDVVSGIGVNVDPSDVVRELRGFAARAGAPPMSDVAEELKVAIDDVIQAAGAVAGRPMWPPRGGSDPDPGRALLILTGELANIQTAYGADYAIAGSPAPYAKYHVSDQPRHQLPRRDFLDIDESETYARIADLVLQDVTR